MNSRFSGFRPFLNKLYVSGCFLDLNKTRMHCASKCSKLILLLFDEENFKPLVKMGPKFSRRLRDRRSG